MPPIRTDKLNEIVRRTNESNSARLRALIEQRRRDLSLDRSPLMYQPYQPSVPDTPTPLRYEPQPHYGLYEYPTSTGMAEGFPITTPWLVAAPAVTRPEEVVEDLFSEEAMARRALKQRYAESNFDNKAKSHAGAMGAWQIMPITYKDYLGRGRGKAGDLNDPEYNRKVRGWVMGIIPRDLQDLYSENDAPRVKLAKIYGAYNWGAGNMRKYLREQRNAGVDISNDTAWVEGLNPETKRYIKYLALDEDIPDSTYTNRAFEEAAAKRGYMAEGGKMFKTGGPAYPYGSLRSLVNGVANTYLVDYINRGNVFGYPRGIKSWLKNYAMSPYNKIGRDLAKSSENDIARRALLSKYLGVTEGLDFDPSEYVEESPYKPSISTDEGKIYYRLKAKGRDDRRAMFDAVAGMYKTGKGVDKDGRRYLSLYDIWDLAPFSGKAGNELPGNPVELYDRIYEDEDPFTYYRYFPEDKPQNDKPNSDIPNNVLVDIRNFWSSVTNQNASGGSIHIKPKNRGKFNALLKRTGKSASWFKKHGTPLQRKRATFALNARKWKHGDGGLLDKLGSVYGNDRARMLDAIKKIRMK